MLNVSQKLNSESLVIHKISEKCISDIQSRCNYISTTRHFGLINKYRTCGPMINTVDNCSKITKRLPKINVLPIIQLNNTPLHQINSRFNIL